MVYACGIVFAECRQIDPRRDRTHAVLKVEVLTVTQRAALDVVLLGGNPGARPIGSNHGRTKVIGDAAPLQCVVDLVAVSQSNRALYAE